MNREPHFSDHDVISFFVVIRFLVIGLASVLLISAAGHAFLGKLENVSVFIIYAAVIFLLLYFTSPFFLTWPWPYDPFGKTSEVIMYLYDTSLAKTVLFVVGTPLVISIIGAVTHPYDERGENLDNWLQALPYFWGTLSLASASLFYCYFQTIIFEKYSSERLKDHPAETQLKQEIEFIETREKKLANELSDKNEQISSLKRMLSEKDAKIASLSEGSRSANELKTQKRLQEKIERLENVKNNLKEQNADSAEKIQNLEEELALSRRSNGAAFTSRFHALVSLVYTFLITNKPKNSLSWETKARLIDILNKEIGKSDSQDDEVKFSKVRRNILKEVHPDKSKCDSSFSYLNEALEEIANSEAYT